MEAMADNLGKELILDSEAQDQLSDCLPFQPSSDQPQLRESLQQIPRYLFRVFSPKSKGLIDSTWAKSGAVVSGKRWSKKDLLSLPARQVAVILDGHTRGSKWCETNLVSWTSSFLVASRFIMDNESGPIHYASWNDRQLCVVDTSQLPQDTFLSAEALIRTYQELKSESREEVTEQALEGGSKDLNSPGASYLGEYLSQGALRIENHCKVISARAMIEVAASDLMLNTKSPSWQSEVIRLRRPFETEPNSWRLAPEGTIALAIELGDLFGPPWRLLMVASLLSLSPCTIRGYRVLDAYEEKLPAGM
jgi:hypothetical protein